jgi:hypothetical protein
MVAASTTTFDIVRGLHDGSANTLSISLSNIKEFFRSGYFNIQPKNPRRGCQSAGCKHKHGPQTQGKYVYLPYVYVMSL